MENVLKPKINKQITLYWWFFEEVEKNAETAIFKSKIAWLILLGLQ